MLDIKHEENNIRPELLRLFREPVIAIEGNALRALVAGLSRGALPPYSLSVAATARINGARSSRQMVVPVTGLLTRDSTYYGSSYGAICAALEKALDPSIDSVILYVDSPGGEVTGLPETAALVAQVAKVKPVTAIVGGDAASAAYWLTSQASEVVLTPSGQVGSVGVRAVHFDISAMLEKDGVKVTEIFAGEYKTEGTPFAPLTKEAKGHLQELISKTYGDFLDAVRRGRGGRATEKARTTRFGNGRMLNADDAKRLGMVDRIQSVSEFFRVLEKQGASTFSAHRAHKLTPTISAQRARLEATRARHS